MNAKFTNKSFWSRTATIFMIVLLVLTAIPAQSARADTAGFSVPTIYSNSALLNTGNAYASDNVYVQSTGSNKSAEYGNFGFSIPAGSTINLVEVSVEGHGNKNWKVAVSKNNGASYSAFTTIINTTVDTTTVTGGTGTLWGLTGWTAASLNDANFRVKISSASGNPKNIAYLDQLMVKVTYSLASAIPTTLVMTAPSVGTYGGTVNLQATLKVTSGNVPLNGKTISFTLDGFSKGTAITNASGVATLNNVTLTTGLSGTLLNVGTYNVSATFVGDSTYAFSSDAKSQVINPLAVTVTSDAKSKVYGTSDPALTYSSAPALIGTDTFSGALTRAAGENIGTHAITQGTLALSPNYTITYVGANLTITALGITVTADNKAVHVGDGDPTFTFGVSNFVGLDTFIAPPTCGVSVSHSALGTYPITCSGGNAGPNYSITYNNGTLTVTNKFVLIVTADPKSINYGDSDPAFTFAYSGFVDGDTAITGTAPACGVPGPHTNVGSYPSIACSGGLDVKYEFSYTSAKLTVNPLAVTVTANPQNKTYGAVDPALTYGVVPALVSGDSFSGTLTRATGEDVATYAITKGTLALNANYTLTYVGANLTINKAPLTVTPDDQSMGIGAADPIFTFDYTGLMNGEDSGVIDTPPACGVSVPHSVVGTYAIVCSGGLDNNYSFVYVNGILTVVQNQIDAYLSGNYMGSYFLNSTQGFRDSFQSVNTGPIKVVSANSAPFLVAERDAWLLNGVVQSFSEMMGLPGNQVTDTYYFPWYNNVTMDTQLRFANLGNNNTNITVTIAGVAQPVIPLAPGVSTRVSYPVNNGPVKVQSSGNVPIIVAERDAWLINGVVQSFSEMMGLPSNKLTDTYYFPWYNNVTMDTQLRFANLGNTSTDITVTIAGVAQTPITVAAGQSTRVSYPVNDGPVKVQSSGAVPIIVAERDAWLINGVVQSFSEMMGLPSNQLTDTYYFPWYNNVTMDTQLRFANLGNTSTDITVTIAGVAQTPITVPVGTSTRVSYPVNNGPVKVQSTGGVPILVAERDAWLLNGAVRSFSEMMGLPGNQLATTYYFPWYNNVTMDTQLRFAVP